ncbi:HalOD1 output domain-containing protein [Halorussus limi]|uniref:HalOD1 output domain-containing protein n=1 Tax=Halorussus limi TaxID=2938695 RepID=UPI0034A4BB5A
MELLEYYPEENTYRAFYGADQDPPSIAVVSAVAAVSDTEPTEMDSPLCATVDPDALNALASPRRTTEGDLHVTFAFHGYEVTISDYGCITIQPLSSTGKSPATGDSCDD